MGIPEKAIIYGDKIIELIPQRNPFLFIDSFYGNVDNLFYSGFTPKEGECFVDSGHLTEPGIIENMAQSAAAATGWSFMERCEEIPLGYIGAVSDFELFKLPEIGVEILTEVMFCGEYGGISLVEAESKQKEQVLAKGKLKIFINNKEE